MECSARAYCPPKSAVEMRCSRGTSSNGTDRESVEDCIQCPRGKYQRDDGMGACETCGTGNYSANELACEFCPVGKFCPLDDLGRVFPAGEDCPSGSTTEGRGSKNLSDCGCQGGTYRDNTTAGQYINCKQCPVGAACKGLFGITLAQLPLEKGYWRTNKRSSDLRRCPVHPGASKKSTGCVGGVGDEGPCKAYV